MKKIRRALLIVAGFFSLHAHALEINTSPLFSLLMAEQSQFGFTINALVETQSESGKYKILLGPTAGAVFNDGVYGGEYLLGYRLEIVSLRNNYLATGTAVEINFNSDYVNYGDPNGFSYLISGWRLEKSNFILKFGAGLFKDGFIWEYGESSDLFFLPFGVFPALELKLGYRF